MRRDLRRSRFALHIGACGFAFAKAFGEREAASGDYTCPAFLINVFWSTCFDLQPERGVSVSQPVLIQFFQEIPDRQEGENARRWAQRFQAGLEKFKIAVKERYSGGTLERLLSSSSAQVRQ